MDEKVSAYVDIGWVIILGGVLNIVNMQIFLHLL